MQIALFFFLLSFYISVQRVNLSQSNFCRDSSSTAARTLRASCLENLENVIRSQIIWLLFGYVSEKVAVAHNPDYGAERCFS